MDGKLPAELIYGCKTRMFAPRLATNLSPLWESVLEKIAELQANSAEHYNVGAKALRGLEMNFRYDLLLKVLECPIESAWNSINE